MAEVAEVAEVAEWIERAFLEHAGLVEKTNSSLDKQFAALVGNLDEKSKRRLMFELAAKLNSISDNG